MYVMRDTAGAFVPAFMLGKGPAPERIGGIPKPIERPDENGEDGFEDVRGCRL
jgi:hypothetical protein